MNNQINLTVTQQQLQDNVNQRKDLEKELKRATDPEEKKKIKEEIIIAETVGELIKEDAEQKLEMKTNPASIQNFPEKS